MHNHENSTSDHKFKHAKNQKYPGVENKTIFSSGGEKSHNAHYDPDTTRPDSMRLIIQSEV